jgi:hypothetical protein
MAPTNVTAANAIIILRNIALFSRRELGKRISIRYPSAHSGTR